MEIFEAEIQDGLENMLTSAKASFAFDSLIEHAGDTSVIDKLLKSTASVMDSDELYPIKTVLVSTGWNANDDVFLPDEMYLARNTPQDKPINYMHNELEIIGHMTGNHCVDAEGKTVAEDLELDKVPSEFHIITDGVLYVHWETEAKKKLLASIIDTINEKKGRVSMECCFAGFDYAVMKGDKQYIIARNKSNAFLTKFLKVYGGSGVYDGCRVGRALRSISFSGKGIVNNPANPKSIIITDTLPFKGIASVVDEVLGEKQKEITVMSEEIQLKAQVAELNKAIASLTQKNEELSKTIVEQDVKAVKADLDAAKAAVATKDAELSALAGKVTAGEALVGEMKTKLESAEAALKEANEKIAKAAAEQVKAGRISQLVEAGLEKAAAEAKFEKFGGLSDEMFAEVVALVKPNTAAASTTVETPAAKTEDAPTGAQVVENADKGKDAALASTAEGEKTTAEKTQTALAEFAKARLAKNKKA